MIKADLCHFMDRVIDSGRMSAEDARDLRRTILDGGLATREEAEALLALGRSLETEAGWAETLVRLMVDFVVWRSRPAGVVTPETSRWLAAALDASDMPETAMHIAYAVVEEAQAVDEALLSFILRGRQRAPQVLAA